MGAAAPSRLGVWFMVLLMVGIPKNKEESQEEPMGAIIIAPASRSNRSLHSRVL